MNSCLLDYEFEEIYDDCESESLENTEIQNSIKELEPIIKKVIKNYFFDKKLHNGMKIEEDLLNLPYYFSLIMKTSVSDGVIKGYEIMEDNGFLQDSSCDQNSISEEIRYMINLIRKIQKWVPQEFVGGMILMHLELIEGMEICQIC